MRACVRACVCVYVCVCVCVSVCVCEHTHTYLYKYIYIPDETLFVGDEMFCTFCCNFFAILQATFYNPMVNRRPKLQRQKQLFPKAKGMSFDRLEFSFSTFFLIHCICFVGIASLDPAQHDRAFDGILLLITVESTL